MSHRQSFDLEISRQIRMLGLHGFGGKCYEVAEEINKKVFGGRGRLVGVANAFWLLRGRFIGHVAVAFRRKYWDSDGVPKSWEDIETWGMLDPHDVDYQVPGWNETAAYKVRAFRAPRDVRALRLIWNRLQRE